MSKYLVTGTAGFIASKVAELLLDQGHTVVGIDNMNAYHDLFDLDNIARSTAA